MHDNGEFTMLSSDIVSKLFMCFARRHPMGNINPFRIELHHGNIPDSKVHGANVGPIWGRQDPGGPHVGPMNLAIWDVAIFSFYVVPFSKKEIIFIS